MIEGSGSNSKRPHFLPYNGLPLGLRNRPAFIFNRLYNISKVWISEAQDMRGFKVNMRERLTLEMLYVAKDKLPQHVIGGQLNITPSLTTILINRLVGRGLVKREENPSNRREALAFLTGYGTGFVERMLSTIDAKTKDVLASLPEGALAHFTRLAVLVITEMEKDAAYHHNSSCLATLDEVTNA